MSRLHVSSTVLFTIKASCCDFYLQRCFEAEVYCNLLHTVAINYSQNAEFSANFITASLKLQQLSLKIEFFSILILLYIGDAPLCVDIRSAQLRTKAIYLHSTGSCVIIVGATTMFPTVNSIYLKFHH